MRFLNQLRQQSHDKHGLKLCYLLHVGQNSNNAHLQLYLAEFEHGQLKNQEQPYEIQASHLKTPPAFLGIHDIALIQQLLQDRPNKGPLTQYQASPSIYSIAKCSSVFLARLLETGRCFIEQPQGNWLSVHQGEDHQIKPFWHFDAYGAQILRWQNDSSLQLFFISNIPFVLQSKTQSIHRGSGTLSSDAIGELRRCQHAVSLYDVSEFISLNQERWQALHLPLPLEPSPQNYSAQLIPILRLHATPAKRGPDLLSLEFRYCSDQFCTTITEMENSAPTSYWDGSVLRCLIREKERERELCAELLNHLGGFSPSSHSLCWIADEDNSWQVLLTQAREHLQNHGFRFVIESGFRHHYVIPEKWLFDVKHLDDQHWKLSIQLHLEDRNVELLDLLSKLDLLATQEGSDHHTLALGDGCLLLLPIKQIGALTEELHGLLKNNDQQLPISQLGRLAQLHDNQPENTQWTGDTELLDNALDLRQMPALQTLSLDGLNAELRHYQQHGVCWLQHIKKHQSNGLLADDMGLGKTLQTLAHLFLEKQLGQLQEPVLIIAPTSLIHNWSNEIRRFTPTMTCQIMHGQQRHLLWETITQHDLVITSYALAARDIDLWQQYSFSWLVLDEAQMIKNSHTRVSQSVRQIHSQHRLCLSGTPVENHLGELWSIFDFLMPGCLGSTGDFKRHFRKPIEQYGNQQRLQQLLGRVAPLMLRRTKNEVAKDLPAKTEIIPSIVMGDEQYAFYEELKSKSWWELQDKFSQHNGEGQQHIQVLAALLKLRQACCDPQLLGENIASAKRELCMQMIEELVAEKRAVLLISQFTSMLDLLANELQKMDIPYLMLTGATKNRQQAVDAFQAGDAPVFLISLKAGGVGLNLTRADTVIHYDPWWNSAAERQATDRAHRIGQDKQVFVYKLIVENTIEEKIAQLQERKAILSESVNHQAQHESEQFSIGLGDLLNLIKEEDTASC